MRKLIGSLDYRFFCIVLLVVIPYFVFSSKGYVSSIFKPSPGITNVKNGHPDGTWGIGYYTEQSRALMKGQLNLLVDPPPELLALPDPYDPVKNQPFRLHDASLFNGKYYLYWSPLPAVLFYIPFRALVGHYPSDGLANLFFYFCTAILFGLLIQSVFKNSKWRNDKHFTFFLIFFGYAFALNPIFTFQIASPAIYAVAIACSTTFVTLSFFLLMRIFDRPQVDNKLVAILSLAAGVAVAVRPNLGPAYVVLFCIVSYAFFSQWKIEVPAKTKALLLLWSPFCMIMLGFVMVNYVRFHSLTEFGIKYQLTAYDNPTLKFFDLSPQILRDKIMFNLKYYFLIQPRSSNAFPFFLAQPANHMPSHMVLDTPGIGLFWAASPIFIIGGLALKKLFQLSWNKEILKPEYVGAAVFILVNITILLIMNMACVRYITEVVAVAWILSARAFASHRLQNPFAKNLLFVSLLLTTILGFSYGFMGDWTWASARF